MIETALGKLEFHVGFKKNDTIEFCGEKKEIIIKAKAYYEEDGITEEQKNAIDKYQSKRVQEDACVTDLVLKFDKDAKKRFIPKTLLFGRNGECALLCDDVMDPDEGIAICIFPEKKVVSQDDYL